MYSNKHNINEKAKAKPNPATDEQPDETTPPEWSQNPNLLTLETNAEQTPSEAPSWFKQWFISELQGKQLQQNAVNKSTRKQMLIGSTPATYENY